MLLRKIGTAAIIILLFPIFSFAKTTTEITPSPYHETVSDPLLATSAAPVELADTYFRAIIISILDQGIGKLDGQDQEWQTLQLKILNGNEKNKRITINHSGLQVQSIN